jgi:hypothetical protein
MGVNPQDNERFFDYAASGEKKMNSNQKDSYLFTPPVAPICGAADGDPKNPSFHKPTWSIDHAGTELFDLYVHGSILISVLWMMTLPFTHLLRRGRVCVFFRLGPVFWRWRDESRKLSKC